MKTQWIYRLTVLMLSTAGFGLVAGDVRAQGYPNKPITYVVPYGPGGGNDLIARILAQKVGETWTQPIVVENRPGATGGIAMEMTARAAPDGHTIVIASTSQILNQYVSNVRYNIAKDFAPVSLSGSMPFVVAVGSSLPVKSINELVALAKSKPGKVNYAAQTGSALQFMGEMLKSARGIDIVMIPYKSVADAEPDVFSGRVEIWFAVISAALPHAKAGKVRILGVAGDKRLAALPDVPTMAEAGVPTLDVSTGFFTLAPAATPKPVINMLNGQIVRAMGTRDVRDRLTAAGIEPKSSTPEELDALLKSEAARWSKIVKETGIRMQ